MDSLVNLNTAASDFLLKGDVEGIQKCVEYSLSGKRLLQEVFESKRYEFIMPMMPILVAEFYANNPIATEIYVDLYERKLVSAALPLPYFNRRGILERAVERKIAIDFSLCYEECRIFERNDEGGTYYRILQSDCLELFILYRREIMKHCQLEMSVGGTTYFFSRILKSISVDEKSCRETLTVVLGANPFVKRNEEHYTELLHHLCAAHDCREVIYRHLFVKLERYALSLHYDSLIRVAACYDERVLPKVAELVPKTFTRLFSEDV